MVTGIRKTKDKSHKTKVNKIPLPEGRSNAKIPRSGRSGSGLKIE
jgi:hypothetical protein